MKFIKTSVNTIGRILSILLQNSELQLEGMREV